MGPHQHRRDRQASCGAQTGGNRELEGAVPIPRRENALVPRQRGAAATSTASAVGEKGDVITLPRQDRAAAIHGRAAGSGRRRRRRPRGAAAVAGRAPGAPEGRVRARPHVPRDGAGGRLLRGRSTRRRRATPRAPTSRSAASAPPCASGSASATRPARWDALSSHLAAHKIPPSDLERLGLVGVNERGRYDFFRDRVMLPVIDRQKRVIGFGGRLLDPEAKDRKYVNSPESPLFHKKESLYGLHAALDAIRRTRRRHRRRGELRRARAARGGHRGGRRADGHGADRGADRRARAGSPRRSSSCSTATPPASARREGDPAVRRRRTSTARIARLPPGVDPDDFVRQPDDGPDAFRRLVDGRAADAGPVHPGRRVGRQRSRPGRGAARRSPRCWSR